MSFVASTRAALRAYTGLFAGGTMVKPVVAASVGRISFGMVPLALELRLSSLPHRGHDTGGSDRRIAVGAQTAETRP